MRRLRLFCAIEMTLDAATHAGSTILGTMRAIPSILRILLAVGLFVTAIPSAFPQPGRDRLILKDGSYQVIVKYEMKGDRVRYFSAERNEWEEIPASLIDWPATEKWKHDHDPSATKSGPADPNDPGQVEAAKIDAEEYAARNDELARMPIISPGLRLPDESGVWILDTYHDEPELVHALQANGDLNRATEHSILRAAFGATGGAKELVRIEGATSKVQLHVDQPVIYVSLDRPADSEDTAPESALTVDTHGANAAKDKNSHSSPDSRYAIIRLNSSHNLRTAIGTEVYRLDQPRGSEDIVETTKEILPGARWLKLTLKQPLLIGEYALIEILSPHEVNLDVWDFGVNPRARENKDTRSPVETP
jgi:hypothetical protein